MFCLNFSEVRRQLGSIEDRGSASQRSLNCGLPVTIKSGYSSATAVEETSGLIRLNSPLADAQASQE